MVPNENTQRNSFLEQEKFENALDFLPEAMVAEMLKKHADVVNSLGNQLREVSLAKQSIRQKLEELGLVRNVNDILGQRSYTTTVGIDGSFVVIKQLSLDTVAVAAVAVEGLVPPKETRHWEKPQHIVNIFPVPHNSENARLCRGMMFSYELQLANKAPHSVVFLDGSLTSQLIGVGQSLSAIKEFEASGDLSAAELTGLIEERLEMTFKNYLNVLESPQVDRMFVGVPKYSSRNEVILRLIKGGLRHTILTRLNDKGLLSTVLKAGEVVGPVPLTRDTDRWHLSGVPAKYHPLRDKITKAIEDLCVLYFKPSPAHPALRLEISKEAASNEHRLSSLLDALLDQARIAGVIEPYPIHIADMFVKQVHGALAELRDAALSDLVAMEGTSFSDVFLSLQNYRTEGGFD